MNGTIAALGGREEKRLCTTRQTIRRHLSSSAAAAAAALLLPRLPFRPSFSRLSHRSLTPLSQWRGCPCQASFLASINLAGGETKCWSNRVCLFCTRAHRRRGPQSRTRLSHFTIGSSRAEAIFLWRVRRLSEAAAAFAATAVATAAAAEGFAGAITSFPASVAAIAAVGERKVIIGPSSHFHGTLSHSLWFAIDKPCTLSDLPEYVAL